MSVVHAEVSERTPDLAFQLDSVKDPAFGAVTTFIGQVRDNDPDADQPVVGLEYTAHPDASETLARLARETLGETRAHVSVQHRVGDLVVGDIAVIVVVAAAHRADAFRVCRDLIEAIKIGLPVWKRQRVADGSTQWKGLSG